jgi:DNA recombination protein RmuC
MIYLILALIILVLILLFLLLRRESVKSVSIEDAFLKVWKNAGIEEKIGALTLYAKQIREDHKALERMLSVPHERASFGEMALESILSDQLPPNIYQIRKQVWDGKVPDAHIRSSAGLICIDSKFPLQNYRKMQEAEDEREREHYKRQFLKDVEAHLQKIAKDYICPQKGSAEFAFAFIPSEGVYHFLLNEAFQLLHDYTKEGVQVVSPLTLSHKVELIKAGIHARKLSQEAERVREQLLGLSKSFSKMEELWRTFYHVHIKNLVQKAEELDTSYKKVQDEFLRIKHLEEKE